MGRSLSQQQQAVSALVQIFPPQTPLSSEGKERAFESLRGKDGNFAGRVKREQVEFEGKRQEARADRFANHPKMYSSYLENKQYLCILHNNLYEHQYYYRVAVRLKDDVYPLVSLTLTCQVG